MVTPVKIFVTGSKGRMGQSVIKCAAQDTEIEMAGGIDKVRSLTQIRPDLRGVLPLVAFRSAVFRGGWPGSTTPCSPRKSSVRSPRKRGVR